MKEPGSDRASNESAVYGSWRVALLYLALTLLLAYPLSVHPAGTVMSTGTDTDYFMWTLGWDTHAFTHQPFSIFDANIFYPRRRTLAYSENLIGSALFAAPILWLTDNPVLAMNLVALLSCVLCGLGAYTLARRVGVGPPGAILSGLIFGFSPPRFLRLVQLHLATIQWMPFGLASLHAYLNGKRKLDLRLAAAFFTLQALTSGHGAVFLTTAALGLVAYSVARGEPIDFTKRLRDLGVPGVLLLAPAVLIFLQYRSVQVAVGLRRTLDNWGITGSSFLASPSHVQTFLLSLAPAALTNEPPDAYLFPGYLPLLLASAAFLWPVPSPDRRRGTWWTRAAFALEIVTLVYLVLGVVMTASGAVTLKVGTAVLFRARRWWRVWLFCALSAALRVAIVRRAPFDALLRLRRRFDAFRRRLQTGYRGLTLFYGLLTLVCVWLMLGPPIGLWQFVYWLPGLNFVRVPSRFILLTVLAVAVLAGIGFERVSAGLTRKHRFLLATAVGAILVVEFAAMPLGTKPYHVDIPDVDQWLAGQPKPFAVAEVPLPDSDNVVVRERRTTLYMLHSMAHWQKTVHGYSGILPPHYQELYWQLTKFPDESSLRSLTDLGVAYVVVHSDLYRPGEWTAVEERLERFQGWLKLERVDRAGRVYSLRHPS